MTIKSGYLLKRKNENSVKNTRLLTTVTVLISSVDLFTDMSAILNLLDLRSIMGCQGGTRSVFSRSFPAKREVQCIFLGKKTFVITFKDGTTIFFFHFNLFLEKLKEQLARKRA